jgi:hypothetical protein
VVHIGGVLVDGGGGLSAQVAVSRIEVERAHVMGAVGAGELHAAFNASHGVEAFHRTECSPFAKDEKARGLGSEGNEQGRDERSVLGIQSASGLTTFRQGLSL